MAPLVTWGPLRPPPTGPTAWGTDRAGDIFIARGTRAQSRWTGTAWEVVTPVIETRGDVLPTPAVGNGVKDQVLVRSLTTDPFAVEWADPGPGLIWQDNFNNLSTWVCSHLLRSRFVSVLAIKDDGTIMVPDIDYANATTNIISLKFEEDVSGTAIIRR